MNLHEQIYSEILGLPEDVAAEVLDFARFLRVRRAPANAMPARSVDFSVFDAVPNIYEGPLMREELYDRASLR